MRENGEHPTLILFDIDGTLLASGGCGRASMSLALQELYNFPGAWGGYSLGGKTDWQILAEQIGPLGYTPDEVAAELPAFAEATARYLQAIIHDFDVRSTPGALALVEALRRDPRARLGLVTGNLGVTVPIKLGAAGFDPADFPIGAYGHESADRNDLPPLALQRARVHWGTAFAPEQIVVVGDTPADVICARSVDGRAVAVLTGFATRQALTAETPYAILDDLTDRAAVEAALFGENHHG